MTLLFIGYRRGDLCQDAAAQLAHCPTQTWSGRHRTGGGQTHGQLVAAQEERLAPQARRVHFGHSRREKGAGALGQGRQTVRSAAATAVGKSRLHFVSALRTPFQRVGRRTTHSQVRHVRAQQTEAGGGGWATDGRWAKVNKKKCAFSLWG